MNPNDVLITGPPRSGTTLTCELLNALDDTVALDEPMDVGPWLGRPASTRARRRRWWHRRPPAPDPSQAPSIDTFCDLVERFFVDVRGGLLAGEGAVSKAVGGEITASKFADRTGRSGHRETEAVRTMVAVDKPLSDGFILAVKHVSGFTAALGELSRRFRSYAIVRNPLSTLGSWNSVQTRFRQGRVPRGERLDPDLKDTLDAIGDPIDRQFALLRWFYGRFADFLPPDSVIRYEDIVATGGRALSVISPAASGLDRALQSRNRASVYDRDLMTQLGERLLTEDGRWWEYYSPDDIEQLMEEL